MRCAICDTRLRGAGDQGLCSTCHYEVRRAMCRSDTFETLNEDYDLPKALDTDE